MIENHFFSAGAILFYILITVPSVLIVVMLVSLWRTARIVQKQSQPSVSAGAVSSIREPPQIISEPDDYQENLEYKHSFQQFIRRDAYNVWEISNAVMDEIIKKLRTIVGIYTNFGRSLEYVMRPLNEEKAALDRILQAGRLSNREFTILQKRFCVFFREYHKTIHWIRDAGNDAGFKFSTSENYTKLRMRDSEMRKELKGFLHHPIFQALLGPHDSVVNNIEWNDWW